MFPVASVVKDPNYNVLPDSSDTELDGRKNYPEFVSNHKKNRSRQPKLARAALNYSSVTVTKLESIIQSRSDIGSV